MNSIVFTEDLERHLKVISRDSRERKFEACGLLIGRNLEDGTAMPENFCYLENIGSAMIYEPDPQQFANILMQTSIWDPKKKLDLCAVFHTHPNVAPVPSFIDLGMARKCGYKTIYVIAGGVSQDTINAFDFDGTPEGEFVQIETVFESKENATNDLVGSFMSDYKINNVTGKYEKDDGIEVIVIPEGRTTETL